MRIQKLNGRFLLELEPVAHGIAGVDQQSHLQGQIGLTAEAAQFRRFPVVQNFEIVFLQIFDVVPVFVGDRENHAHFVDRLDDRVSASFPDCRIVREVLAPAVPAAPAELPAGAGRSR